jgi:hypothetical protein
MEYFIDPNQEYKLEHYLLASFKTMSELQCEILSILKKTSIDEEWKNAQKIFTECLMELHNRNKNE